ncbi:MAG: hypothetical protein JO101_08545 [Candidatus Eremiobacteraeota bacterium]|nr:hypothetical protein [Candidatus Eremiobacteraeota bacterium]
MAGRLTALALATAFSALPLGAGAENAGSSVRKLVFAVKYASQSDVVVGEDQRMVVRRGVQVPAGSYTRRAQGGLSGAGSITVTVLGVAKDRSLLVDAEEDVENRAFGRTRFTVSSEGDVFYDPRFTSSMHSEIVELLRLLAVKLLVDHDVVAGTHWTLADDAKNGSKTERNFTIVSVNADGLSNVDIDRLEHVPGPAGYEATIGVKMLYDPKMLVPVRAAITSRVESAAPDVERQVVVETTQIELAHDSFSKK